MEKNHKTEDSEPAGSKQVNRKRHIEQGNHSSTFDPPSKRSSNIVAQHYNQLPERGLHQRNQSKIYFMRNYNNWVKSVLLKTYQNRLYDEGQESGIHALDLGCGKGGDLLKWIKGNVKKLVCTDIASTSVEQCKERYLTNKNRSRGKIFDAEFIVADSSHELLSKKYDCSDWKFDLVSSQFVVHYAFESEAQARTMMQNACENLRDGGYFVGSTVNANELRKRLDRSSTTTFKNDVYGVTFDSKEDFKDFTHKYNFHLDGVVDCPEYVAKRETLVSLAESFGMKLVMWKTFSDFFTSNSDSKTNKELLKRIKALEYFPSRNLNSDKPKDYDHAKEVCDDLKRKNPGCFPRIATLSATEWEAASLYVAFAFKKVSSEDKAFDVPMSDESRIPLLVLSL